MSTTQQHDLTPLWKAYASGYGDASFTCADEALWIITETVDIPTLTYGHVVRAGKTVSLMLSDKERLWLKGNGTAVVTADHPLT
ncbi:hypothetical protein C5F48_20565 [Cereibacter changlensis JA139]|uniref:AraC family transcriptional regulator n=2 Tax=Cereibacter changlensis TaxID=402884 RepID=A0A2T4JPP0_9RHOB|nr:hypothetical protein [Cereibacter changlensis]PTE19880.1 hypothetical protein C5F48_20565 [Cereibacter changlensis JA139]PZX46437.1 hypothetical protein LX76_04650 [Cereibacter changlensis]